MSDLDPAELRRIAGQFATGVTVVTATHEGRPCGLTVNSFTSVSLDPPLVLVCLARTARAYGCIDTAGRFAVNVLSDEQEDLARLFASRSEDKFNGLAYRTSERGSPIFDGVHAWLECEVAARYAGGQTHTIYIARVVALGSGRGHPLVFHAGQYRGLATGR